jgi:uncharacterized protein
MLALMPAAAQAAGATPATQAAVAVTDTFVLPRYHALTQAALAHERVWVLFCFGRMSPRSETLIATYHTLADRWAEIEFVKTGPMSLFFRAERFNYWPDPRNATERNLEALLASNDPKALEPATLASNSIPAQGISALERLLFDPAFAQHEKRCKVAVAIARNLAAIGSAVTAEWAGASGVRFSIAANRDWKGVFANGDEAARLLMTDLVGGFTAMNDRKLLAVMGVAAASAKPRLAEAWRSKRSARNLALNIASLRAMATAFAANIPAPARAKLERSLAAAEVAVKALPADIGAAAADVEGRRKLETARAAIKAAQADVATVLAPALGITLGFNALDGD